MKKLLTFALIIIPINLWSQEIILEVPSIDQEYVLPVDTAFGQVFVDYIELDVPYDSSVTSLNFKFMANGSNETEYKISALFYGNDEYPFIFDTLQFDPTPLSIHDSLFIEYIDYYGEDLLGIRYVDMPGDSLSGFSLQLTNNSSSYQEIYLRFSIAADTGSNWLKFQPLHMGNIWNYSGPFPIYERLRLEILDTSSVIDTTFFSVESRKQYLSEYGDSLVVDTSLVYTLSGNYNRVFQKRGHTPFLPGYYGANEIEYLDTKEGILLRPDGTIDYGWWQFIGGAQLWKYGLGYYYSFGDGWGVLTSLRGYRIDGVTYGDISTIVGIDEASTQNPIENSLGVFPNPFNPSTTIEYDLPEQSAISLIVYDVTGREVQTLVSTNQSPGSYQVIWDGKNVQGNAVPAGLYFARLQAGEYSSVVKMVNLQ